MEITIPNNWTPRDYQMPLWGYLENGGRRAVVVWHRRAGKDSLSLNFTATQALQRVGVYWHMAPTQKQVRKIVWDNIDGKGRRIINQVFPPEIRKSSNSQEMKIELLNGSIWQCVGSDNYDSLVGANPVGVVFSEYSIADPKAWDYIRPILAENGGWALFIYTPRGRNHGARIFDMAKQNPGWFAQLLTVDDTKAISLAAIDEERKAGMDDDQINQEFYCSFDSALPGAYYGKLLVLADKERRIGKVPYEPMVPVITAWDLGIGDSTAIWFCQQVGKEIRIIDYYENSGVGLDHYCKALAEKPYTYYEHLLPHDANVSELGTGKRRIDTLRDMGLSKTRVLPQMSVDDGIHAARMMLPKCWFDEVKCGRGLDALRNYQKEYDDKLQTFKDRPLHDWSSHAADAFRYLAVGIKPMRERRAPATYDTSLSL